MAVERVLPAYVGQEGMIFHFLSNAGMVPFVKHTGLAVRVTGFAVSLLTRVGFASSSLDGVSVTTQGAVSFEIACSESNSTLVTFFKTRFLE